MRNGILPICRKDMEERGWEQLDFVYVSGDATWIIRLLGMRSSHAFWRRMDIKLVDLSTGLER